MTKNVLITGIAGFIGTNLSKKCIDLGWNVYGIDNLRTGLETNIQDGVKKVLIEDCGNIKNLEVKEFLDKDFDYVFHLAAAPSVPESVQYPITYNSINVDQTLNLLYHLKDRCNKFIFASSSSVYGNPIHLPTSINHPKNPLSPYALQKLIGEQYCELYSRIYNLETICLRLFNVYGPYQQGTGAYANVIGAWCLGVKSNKLTINGNGEQTRDFIYVSDVVSALISAAETKIKFNGKAFNIGTSRPIKILDILNKFKERFPNINIINNPSRQGDVQHTLAEIIETTKELNWYPIVDFETGLNKTIDWWKI